MPSLFRHALVVVCCLAVASVGRAAGDGPVLVAASPKAGGHVHPSVCRTPDGTLVVVYKGQNVLLRTRSADGGRTWEAPEPIPTTAKRPDAVREVKKFEV